MDIPMAGAPAGAPTGQLTTEQKENWDKLVAENDLVLFMKGTPDAPQCGFSNRAAQVLLSLNRPFAHVNVFEEGTNPYQTIPALAEWSDFPTLPMVFVKGELIGGSDIALEMYEAGELQEMLAE